jgi:hypothetical protein
MAYSKKYCLNLSCGNADTVISSSFIVIVRVSCMPGLGIYQKLIFIK